MRTPPSNSAPRILLDARPLQGPDGPRGIGRYVHGLLWGLAAEGHGERLGVLLDGRYPQPTLPDAGLVAYSVRRRYGRRLGALEDLLALGSELERIRPALYHATSLSLPGPTRVPVVATVHDLIPWAWGGPAMRGERWRYAAARRRLRAARALIAVSESTAADLERLAGVPRERVTVVSEPSGPAFVPAAGAHQRVAGRWGLQGTYLLFVGALDRRKDPAGLMRAWAAARAECPDLQLVIAGDPGPQAPRNLAGARVLGRVADGELADLYRAAACLVFSSRYEGFGLPILEAMSCGCPVVAYRNSSIPEVAGEACQLVDDGDWRELGGMAARLVRERALARRARRLGLARAARFSSAAAARAVLQVYRRVLG